MVAHYSPTAPNAVCGPRVRRCGRGGRARPPNVDRKARGWSSTVADSETRLVPPIAKTPQPGVIGTDKSYLSMGGFMVSLAWGINTSENARN
jgi:hypothetical protein